uniref:Protein kinase domain-containing protein n=1 Tax=Physcomitrium patens TaxID=3218 RepID=A0A7I4F0C4_PHYPA
MPSGGGTMVEAEKRSYPVLASEYKLYEEIGQGVSAIVYRAHCVTYNEIVAIKSLDLEKCNSNLDNIRREAQTMSLINHQNVVKAHCSFVVGQNLWVVMPHLAGGSCLHIMKAAYPDGFEEPVIATILKESLKALEYLHRHGHIHRDIKAGNILVDSNGSVKLGDFGVSACMFDTGDRQRSRNTFAGTPCWMAPEVMEQLHGYDFKADIWSFGITALELAHGHAPFSKYPPLKVLLMTLQNAPPGLDYERDKKFSKSFKEMIAMCLVKDPAKRPTAEKLLRHSFFKQARSFDYIARHILEGLPPLGETVNNLKIKDANRLAQQIQPYDEQEAQSQNEYKRGVSAWDFNVEDLKAQAALIQDDEEVVPKLLKVALNTEAEEISQAPVTPVKEEITEGDLQCSSPLSQPPLCRESSFNRVQMPVTIHSIIAETTNDAGERVTRIRSGPLPNPVQPKSANISRTALPSGRKEPKHIGRFDVWDEHDGESLSWHGSPRENRKSEARRERDDREQRRGDDRDRKEEREQRRSDERSERDEIRRVGSERVLSSIRGLTTMDERERDRDRDYRQGGRGSDYSGRMMQRERSFSGPVNTISDRSSFDQKSTNGLQAVSRQTPSMSITQVNLNKEISEDKVKAPVQKGPVLHKGRFSVTSDDTQFEESSQLNPRKTSNTQASLHKSASSGDFMSGERRLPVSQHSSSSQHALLSQHSHSSLHVSSPNGLISHQNSQVTTPTAAVLSQLQQIFQQAQKQQDSILHLIQSLNPQDAASVISTSSMSRFSRTSSTNSGVEHSRNSVGARLRVNQVEVSTDRERELLHQVSDLQFRMATLVEELQSVKIRNVHLEGQLNAIYNKEEEERIRKEEAAKGDR